MINPVRGEARLVLPDDREFVLVIDMEAFIEGEAAYRKPMNELIADAKRGFVGATRALLLGSLARYHPDITKEEALELLQKYPEEVGRALNEAGAKAWPDPKKAAAALAGATEGKEDANPPGKNSGVDGVKRASTRKHSGAKRLAPMG